MDLQEIVVWLDNKPSAGRERLDISAGNGASVCIEVRDLTTTIQSSDGAIVWRSEEVGVAQFVDELAKFIRNPQ